MTPQTLGEPRSVRQLWAGIIGHHIKPHDCGDVVGLCRIGEPGTGVQDHLVVRASLPALGGDEWDTAMDAWHEAHPGTRMIHG